ncbi:hypothetical protein RDWZM_003357 [Blomia tropicalis]|uniref:Anion exchange protein n=1 Tax=Blomia tropicalis TaxID=40697 RepID=A0A9Q0MFP3_BLOTA|nr:hypothetical protein RDWZM_003357 [Blomia tropicalis]
MVDNDREPPMTVVPVESASSPSPPPPPPPTSDPPIANLNETVHDVPQHHHQHQQHQVSHYHHPHQHQSHLQINTIAPISSALVTTSNEVVSSALQSAIGNQKTTILAAQTSPLSSMPPPPPPPPSHLGETNSYEPPSFYDTDSIVSHHDHPITIKLTSEMSSSASTASSSSSSNEKASDMSASTINANHANESIIPGDNEVVAVFSELSQLHSILTGHNTNRDLDQLPLSWKETARWVKYEENVEENGTRWSKPYVTTVNLAAFLDLKQSLANGVVILDSTSTTFPNLIDEFLRQLRIKNLVTLEEANQINQLLLLQKKHQFQNKRSIISSIADLRQNSFSRLISRSSSKINCSTVDTNQVLVINDSKDDLSASEMTRSQSNYNLKNDNPLSKNSFSSSNLVDAEDKESTNSIKFDNAFRKKIPLNAVSNNILIGEVNFLSTPISGFIRLQNASKLGNISEVSIPAKFIYIYLGPKSHSSTTPYVHIGRALATLMVDSIFRTVALKTQSVESLIVAIDEFLNDAPILPPNLWDPATRIEPPEQTPPSATLKSRKNNSLQTLNNKENPQGSSGITIPEKITSQSYYNQAFDQGSKTDLPLEGNWSSDNGKAPDYFLNDKIEIASDDEEEIEREKMGLVYSGRLFGGLINDVKRKIPHYWSDFTDALALQSIASIIFLYFACLTPIITFGGLLGDATGNNIATMESLVCGALCGILYGLFSGQPLTILGSTGPVLVFETIVYDFCSTNGFNYLSLRFWIGMWIAAILLLFVAIDASYLVCFITRFTEENFASLISVIFIYKAIEKLFDIEKHYPLNREPDTLLNYECSCMYPNASGASFSIQNQSHNETAINQCLNNDGILFGNGCTTPNYIPDVFLFSVIILIFTYITSVKLKDFRKTRFFSSKVRELVSDFAVPIAIFIMTILDNWSGVKTPKLLVPSSFEPTLPTRTWLVNPFAPENPIWISVVALFPALLGTILIFMDQQITAVIVNRKENKLKKGCGYHLDLFVLCILIAICSIFGLPWFVAATVLSITHVNSLTMHSESAAPGDKPKFLGVREQRVTQIVIFILCGLSIFFTPLLQQIPMPVLYGVFLYMGVSSLKGSQLLIILAVRKLLDLFFTQEELKILDDKMPESKRKKKERIKAKLLAAKKQNQKKNIDDNLNGDAVIAINLQDKEKHF